MKMTVSVPCILFSVIFYNPAFSQNYESGIKPYFSAVVVKNAEESSRWYQSVLGVKFRNLNENVIRGSKIIVLSSENVLLELIEVKSQVLREDVLIGKPEQTLIAGFTKIGFRVSDLDVTMQKLKDLNVNFFGEIYTDPISSKRSFLVHDPDKNLIQFFE
jgi:hypothetical protein